MAWQYHPLLVLFALGGLVSLVVAGYCWHYMQTYGRSDLVTSIGLLGFNNAIWTFAATLKTASTDLDTSLLFYKLEFLGFLPNTAVGIVLALAYVGKDRWLTRRTLALLSALPIAFIILTLVNPGSVMIVDPKLIPAQGIMAFEHEFPALFSVYLAYLYGAVLVAILIIAGGMLTGRTPVTPALVGILALLLPLVAGVLKTSGIYPPGGDGINVAPAASAISMSVFAFAIIRYRVFELIPVGRDQAIEVMDDGYLLVDPNGKILDANPAAMELLVGLSDGDLRNRPVTEVLPVSEDLTETNPVDFETKNRTIEVRRSKVTRQNQDAGEVLLLQDVTEKRQRQRELERTNERLDQFASTVSHDLRNPLNVISGRAELLESDELRDNEEHVDAIKRSATRMEQMIEDLLALSRAGQDINDRKPVSLAAVVADSWENVRTDEVEFEVCVPEAITVNADRQRLMTLLENLFRNASEHNDSPLTIQAGVLSTASGDSDINGFFVEDDGEGIPEDGRTKIFDHGYTTNADGTGFGLSIVEEIAEAHDWTISVTEGSAGGARFEIHTATSPNRS